MSKKYNYRARFVYEGKTYNVLADTAEELAVKKAMKLRDLEEGKVTLSGNTTVSAWARLCIDTYKANQKPNTRKKLMGKINHCILEQIGSMPLRQVKPMHCQQIMNNLQGYSKAYISDIYQALNFIFSHAVDNHLILENPAAHIVRPQGTKESRRAITEYEREHIMKVAVTDRRYYIYLLMLECGCRPSEASEAMGKDIQTLDDGTHVLHIRGTKSSNADRLVPIPPDLYQLIKSTPKFEYIAQKSTGKPLSESERNKLWNSFKRQLNISMGCKMYRNELIPPYPVADDLVPYCLRHTYCTDLARKGIDIRMAQKLMGHADISLTANIYTNLDTDDIKKVAKQLSV